ncbi:hypothetical protein RRG08_020125 [Elysia crispata]|uniref:Uncharacterized protein n=1 Tax=Elysia crispata TaxID=231223 RepID=A0AAE1DSA4_9GAST|nr:hypothetical protein RRG08_020125 [Elysia crispata]
MYIGNTRPTLALKAPLRIFTRTKWHDLAYITSGRDQRSRFPHITAPGLNKLGLCTSWAPASRVSSDGRPATQSQAQVLPSSSRMQARSSPR